MRKRKYLPAMLCMAAVFLLWGGIKAKGMEEGLRAEKTIAALGGRSFRLSYSVWTEGENAESTPCDVLLLLEAALGEEELQSAVSAAEELFSGLAQVSPSSRAGLVVFGDSAEGSGPYRLDKAGLKAVKGILRGIERESTAAPDYTAALREAGKLADALGEGRPLYLVTVASGKWAGEGKTALPELQKLREKGAKSYTVLLCTETESDTEEFWQSMSSAPLSEYHYLCGARADTCLEKLRKEFSSACSVEVCQRLDPRFTISAGEQARLREEGVHLMESESGVWEISWEADLPRGKDAPWKSVLTVRARDDFPGGNGVTTDLEGTGLFKAGKELLSLPATYANVASAVSLRDSAAEIFLGEKVPTVPDGKSVEEKMGAPSGGCWHGRGQTGSLTLFWEMEDGGAVGTLRQLECLTPEKDTVYRLRASWQPEPLKGRFASGSIAGEEAEPVEASAFYRVRVVTGTLQIIAAPPAGGMLVEGSRLFRVERAQGGSYYCRVRPEGDPETGRLFLEGELRGLPFGTYTVTPVESLPGGRETVLCYLGLWERDDTLSTRRNRTQAKFPHFCFTKIGRYSILGTGTGSWNTK